MEKQEKEKILEAGKISAEVREWSKKLVKPGAKILDIANQIEKEIIDKGAGLAFPVNICINDITAHYAPKAGDETVLTDEDVVSVDLGAHVDGYIGDTAYTVDFSGKYTELLEANNKALEESISLVEPGVSVSLIGETVQTILGEYGFKPIANLSGHQIEQYNLHAGLSIPNIKVPYDWEIQEGMTLAFEPFATTGYGMVIESAQPQIYSIEADFKTRDRELRKIMKDLSSREGLPFASRWYSKKINPMRMNILLSNLVKQEVVRAYPPLHEKERGVVSQFEHTLIVTSDGCLVTTK